MSSTRQLAAIMFTDIQGYTAIMQQDEALAVKVRDRHRQIFESATQKHHGKILQYYGDGTLSIFDSAVEAVYCGIELQLGFQKEPKIPVRVGIHLGDIIYDDQDIIGDGVNVASRIEALGVPGGVVISDKVNDELKNQTAIPTLSIGTYELKNVSNPMEVFAVSSDGLVVPDPSEVKRKTQSKAERKYPVAGIGILAVAAVIIGLALWYWMGPSPEFSGSTRLDKSIAVCHWKT